MTAKPVFISYARETATASARRLYETLGGQDGLAFFDENIESLEKFPAVLLDALLAAKVIVIFADRQYFTRWYCLWELQLALAPYFVPGRARSEDLDWIVLAKVTDSEFFLEALPPRLRARNWTQSPVELVRATLAKGSLAICERLSAESIEHLREVFLEQAALLPPHTLAALPHSGSGTHRESLGERFVGRADDLAMLHHLLFNRSGGGPTSAALTTAVGAGGGVGKTTIALEYVHRYGPRFYEGGIFWIDCDQEIDSQWHEALTALGLGSPSIEECRRLRIDLSSLLRNAIAARHPLRTLAVLDNLPESERTEPLAKYWPSSGITTILITSRQTQLRDGVHVFPLHPLAVDAARLLLTSQLNAESLQRIEWDQIANWVGCLPLACDILNKAMRGGAVSPREVLARSRENGVSEALDTMSAAARHESSISGALGLSFAVLSDKAQNAVVLLAQLAPHPIPDVLWRELCGDLATPDVAFELRDRHWVIRTDDDSFGSIHRVVGDWLATSCGVSGSGGAGQSDPRLRAIGAITKLISDAAQGDVTVNERQLLSSLEPHAAVLAPVDPGGMLHSALGRSRLARGLFGQARKSFEEYYAVLVRKVSEDSPSALQALMDVASATMQAGSAMDARRMFEHLLSLSGSASTEFRLGVLNNLALAVFQLGEWQYSSELLERLLVIKRRELGPVHQSTLTTMNNLGMHYEMVGECGKAQSIHKEVLEIRSRLLGEHHIETLISMANLGAVSRENGNLAEAKYWHERAFAGMESALGSEHPYTLKAMDQLGRTYWKARDLKNAEAIQQRACKGMRVVLGILHPDTLACLNNLCLILIDTGEYVSAKKLLEELLSGYRSTLGAEHSYTLSAEYNYVGLLSKLGLIEEMRMAHERLVPILLSKNPAELSAPLRAIQDLLKTDE